MLTKAGLARFTTALTSNPSRAPQVIAGATIGDEVVERVLARVLTASRSGPPLDELLYETVYREDRRLAGSSRDPRTDGDRQFVRWLRRALAHTDPMQQRALARLVIARYTREISGHFDRRVYRFATGVVPPALGALLHGLRPSLHLFDVQDRVLLGGELDAVRALARVGTVVLAPTHVSNLDSLVLGYAIYALGLPPFAYGAGLNLFSNALTGFFMRNLGAFTVDRKKVDPLYMRTVKEYATVLLERGQHMLFFPGGTRSRSGAIETRLKLGLLGTTVTAFGNTHEPSGSGRPLFVVPCTLTYPLVLEASSLMAEYLKREGGHHFVDTRDEFEQPERWLGFLRGLAQLDLQVHVRFGRPLDAFGNPVDLAGVSRDPAGRPIDPVRYMYVNGKVVHDEARDGEYTRLLAEQLVLAYRRATVALPTTVLAFVVFELLRRRYPGVDVFRLLRMLGPDRTVSLDELRPLLGVALEALRGMAARGLIALAPQLLGGDVESVLAQGAATLSTYHLLPVLVQRGNELEVHDPTLLLYYRNRLDGYGLLGAPDVRALGTIKSKKPG